MLRVTVPAGSVRQRGGEYQGRQWSGTFQSVYVHTVDEDGKEKLYPTEVEIRIKDGAQPYPPGEYVMEPRSIYVDRKGKLAVYPMLKPKKVADVRAAS